jgi:glycosyltransferase involved in cell wall biosynthesis
VVQLRNILRSPELVICNSDLVRDNIIKAGAISSRVFPISPFAPQYLEEIWPLAHKRDLEEFVRRHNPLLLCYAYVYQALPSMPVLAGALETLVHEFPNMGAVILGDKLVHEAWIRLDLDDAMTNHIRWEDNLPAPLFLGLLKEASVYIRHSPTDGVASSILESLALRTPVVASRLPGRPKGVVEYELMDCADLAAKLRICLTKHVLITEKIEIPDTVAIEVDLLEKVLA